MFRTALISSRRLICFAKPQAALSSRHVQCHPLLASSSGQCRLLSQQIQTKETQEATASEFSGVVPVEKLQFSFSKSSGAGGQHVNKVNTKVELRFHVDTASWIPDAIKEKVKELQRGRITKDGYMIITSEKTRVQMLNKADALDKLRDIIYKAAVKPYEPSSEELQVKQRRHEKAVKEMLRQKKSHSLKKQSRQGPSIHNV